MNPPDLHSGTSPASTIGVDSIRRIVAWALDAGLSEIQVETATTRLRVVTSPDRPHLATTAGHASTRTIDLTAATAGIFRTRHPSLTEDFVRGSAAVARGTILGLVQRGTLLHPVLAPCAADDFQLRRADGDAVVAGDALFTLQAVGPLPQSGAHP